MNEYERALAQVQRAVEDVTDDQIAVLRSCRPDFAEIVLTHRAMKRAGREYQERVAREEADRAYAADVRRRQFADTLGQREACWRGTEPRPGPPQRQPGVVRVMTPEEIQRLQDRTRGIVRIMPRSRR